ncbi:unnamed protein product [Plutella xylostella]|uniref:(diamondback moth) hypothetical protein n=1 Tax=Plutella xylostella TaxID=51655 RepID=A0A8S4DAE5_PLUXY|nr:unnamed protein product [Plutella xylostella]
MENLKYRVIYEYEFHRGTSAAERARRINDVYGDGVAKENTVRFWFQRFRSGNFDLQNKPRGRPETKVDNEELKAIVEADPSQTTSELAAGSAGGTTRTGTKQRWLGLKLCDEAADEEDGMDEHSAAKRPSVLTIDRAAFLLLRVKRAFKKKRQQRKEKK